MEENIEQDKKIIENVKNLVKEQKHLPKEFSDFVDEKFWELV